ncbi:Isoleucine--tRNA ligase, mitochondrial [Homalodisca vitripennis]|nr:Isoleucine--tRNA ligase, mitochondrial [Homalodisca vitripennis]
MVSPSDSYWILVLVTWDVMGAMLCECGFAELYEWQRKHVSGPEFVLHDGPPYANGVPHMGHAINKVLKDITTRHKLLQGHKIHYKPGWDCHGLPIELKAMAGQDVMSLSPLAVRAQARKFAKEAIRDQKAVFRSWGVMADWEDGCYFTFDKAYVKNQLQQFYKLYEQGLIYRDVKPVYWSPSSRTALAESELEYKEDHESTSAHVRMRVVGGPATWRDEVYALVWTTTPWTLPANQAIAYSPNLAYCLVTMEGESSRYIVASTLADRLATILGKRLTTVREITASELSSLRYEHPLRDDETLPFLPSEHVTADKGTGLVHTAPAHGPDDFKLGKINNLPVTCLVDEGGMYTEEAGPKLAGLAVLTTGCERVLQLCRNRRALVHVDTLRHSYPYDWRSGLPVILRASHQWFLDTSRLKGQVLEALKGVSIVPDRGEAGLVAQIQTRPFWCISRQRVWGVPVPVLYTSSGQPIISQDLINHYCQLLDSEGDDFWWSSSLSKLAPTHLLDKQNVETTGVERGQDILDIWLDSGLSWSGVLDSPTADLYLEGVDQFNGWFQSSLITSVALQGTSPYKTVFVHGFAVDGDGVKMSKSLGNVVNPQTIVRGGADNKQQPAYGVDTLRWWVAAHATQQSSVPVSTTTLADSKASVQRLRSVLRFLLGGVHSLPSTVEPPILRHLDRYMLHCLYHLESQVKELYNTFLYNKVCFTLNTFVANEVSSFYCHLTKDRLYCDAEDSNNRRAVQWTLYHTLITLTRLVAPVAPVLAEEVYSYLPLKESDYLFHKTGPWARPQWDNPPVAALIQQVLDIKQQVGRLSPLNCNNWELAAVVSAASPHWEQLKVLQEQEESCDSELAEILQVSHVTLHHVDSGEGVEVKVGLAGPSLCERCRRHTAPAPDQPCPRCTQVLANLQ